MSKKVITACKYCGKDIEGYPYRPKIYCDKSCMSLDYMKTDLKIGDTVNNWEIISTPYRKYGRLYLDTKCICGSGLEKTFPLKTAEKRTISGCGECSQPVGSDGFGKISGEVWWRIKTGAKKRNIPFKVTSKYVWELFLHQDKKCALTNDVLDFKCERDCRSKTTASLDRIDSSKGYVEGNLQWVHKYVNRMKNEFTQEEYIRICEKVYKNINDHSVLDIKILKLTETPTPKKNYISDACFDCYATSKKDFGDGRIEYGLGFSLQPDILGQDIQFDIRPRSSIHKTGMILSNCIGTGDEGYTGEYKVVFYDVIKGLPNYDVGDKIVQLQCNKSIQIRFVEKAQLLITARNDRGFGSSGK